MDINVVYKKYALLQDKYDIVINNNLMYKARTEMFTLAVRISVYDLNHKEVVSVEKLFKPYYDTYPSYVIIFRNNSRFPFTAKSSTYFKLFVAQGRLEIYEQMDMKLGIFLNYIQIGLIERNNFIIGGGDNYHILLENDRIDHKMIIAFILAFDNFYHNDKEYIEDYNPYFEDEKNVDVNWSPKY